MKLATAIGCDSLGKLAIQRLREHEVDISLVQERDEETGRVNVMVDSGGKPTYCFMERPAWDFIALTPSLLKAASEAHVVCFGTLCQRHPAARETM